MDINIQKDKRFVMGQKHNKSCKIILSESQINSLHKLNGYSEHKIEMLYKLFVNDCPKGFLSRKQFYKLCYPNINSVKYSNRLFDMIDQNNDNKIDFFEFIDMIQKTTDNILENKLEYIFNIYDLNNDNYIDKNELKKIIKNFYKIIDEDVKNYDKVVDYVMLQFDSNNDNKIDLNEFINGCKMNKNIYNSLISMNDII